MNCKEFPMKFPRSLKFPTTLTWITYPVQLLWNGGFFFGRSRGPPERFSAGHGNPFPSSSRRPQPIVKFEIWRSGFLKDQEIWQDSVQGQQRFFPFKKKKSPFMQKCHSKPWCWEFVNQSYCSLTFRFHVHIISKLQDLCCSRLHRK